MQLNKIVLGALSVNCYLLYTDKAVVIIDPAVFNEELNDFCLKHSNKHFTVLLTHCHCDHILGAEQIRNITGAQIMIGKGDEEGLYEPEISLAKMFGFNQHPFYADKVLCDGDVIKAEDITLKVISSPGHTPGGVCYYTEGMLFSGDTLFLESFGRTDFKYGDSKKLKESIDKLLCLPDETLVYSGHGEATTILHEKKYNVYKRYL